VQDKYAGDIGDFGKFVFLNALHEAYGGRLRLGINWYRTTRPERSSNDGRHISYLDPVHPRSDRFRRCAPKIYESLGRVVSGARSISALEEAGLAPIGTRFYSTALPFGETRRRGEPSARRAWFQDSLGSLQESNVVFLDPDNGIAPPALRPTQARAIKYSFLDEMREYFERSEILIVYHHRDRSPAPRYMQKFVDARRAVDARAMMRILRFRRVSVRDYVFLYRAAVSSTVAALFDEMTAAPFEFLFEELRAE
jgi:hypothetical protein